MALPSSPTAEQTTIQPTPVPPTIRPTLIPPTEAIPDPIYFRDDFNIKLESGWQWLREDPSQWSLTTVPGALQIYVLSGHVSAEDLPNILLRPAPQGDFQVETKLTFQPVANFQFAGIVIYQSPLDLIQVGRAYCDLPTTCAGDGLYIDYYQNGNLILPNFARAYTEGEVVYLRLIHESDTYTLQSSPDGSTWTLRGGQVSAMIPQQVGLVAGQNETDPIPALFDYFEIKSLE
jgi:beta-xylosidase